MGRHARPRPLRQRQPRRADPARPARDEGRQGVRHPGTGHRRQPGGHRRRGSHHVRRGRGRAAEQRLLEMGATEPAHQPGGKHWTVLLAPSGQPFCIHGSYGPRRP
ncbi:VOC family protein [Streptomyces sp. CB02923]|uniref:VOC family protein n=1 Tax=Streptomyces sp. CB02923 TaxID=1718985 RepID=UPI00093BF2CA|nr:VOC family protein [Streptomyces sp. CB02923]